MLHSSPMFFGGRKYRRCADGINIVKTKVKQSLAFLGKIAQFQSGRVGKCKIKQVSSYYFGFCRLFSEYWAATWADEHQGQLSFCTPFFTLLTHPHMLPVEPQINVYFKGQILINIATVHLKQLQSHNGLLRKDFLCKSFMSYSNVPLLLQNELKRPGSSAGVNK